MSVITRIEISTFKGEERTCAVVHITGQASQTFDVDPSLAMRIEPLVLNAVRAAARQIQQENKRES